MARSKSRDAALGHCRVTNIDDPNLLPFRCMPNSITILECFEGEGVTEKAGLGSEKFIFIRDFLYGSGQSVA